MGSFQHPSSQWENKGPTLLGVFHGLAAVSWVFLDEPCNFSPSQVPGFAEREW